jgi:hypothetical protein
MTHVIDGVRLGSHLVSAKWLYDVIDDTHTLLFLRDEDWQQRVVLGRLLRKRTWLFETPMYLVRDTETQDLDLAKSRSYNIVKCLYAVTTYALVELDRVMR